VEAVNGNETVQKRMDLNLDAGESSQALRDGSEAALYGVVTSVNIACGGHAGDEPTMREAVRMARDRGLRIGAHPSFPDRVHFGRKALAISQVELEAALVDQITSLAKICAQEGAALEHVKPHGALYNLAATDRELAGAIIGAVKAVAGLTRASRPKDSTSSTLAIVGLASSPFLQWAEAEGLKVVGEAFADRRYEEDSRLRDRRYADALIENPFQAAAQAVAIACEGHVVAISGKSVPVSAGTICIHGDTPGALGVAKEVRRALEAAGVRIG